MVTVANKPMHLSKGVKLMSLLNLEMQVSVRSDPLERGASVPGYGCYHTSQLSKAQD